MVYICDSTPLTMNKVDNLLKNLLKNLKHEEQVKIKRLCSYQPRDISSKKMVGNRGHFYQRGLIKNCGLRPAMKKRAYFAFAVSYLEVRVYGQIKVATT